MQSGTDALVSWHVHAGCYVAVTYKVWDVIPLVPTEQQACHFEDDGIAMEKGNGKASDKKATLRREVVTQLI